MMICANAITQYGGLAVISQPRDWFQDTLKEYDRRRHLWTDALDRIGLPYTKPQGAYYVFIDIRPTGLNSSHRAILSRNVSSSPGAYLAV